MKAYLKVLAVFWGWVLGTIGEKFCRDVESMRLFFVNVIFNVFTAQPVRPEGVRRHCDRLQGNQRA